MEGKLGQVNPFGCGNPKPFLDCAFMQGCSLCHVCRYVHVLAKWMVTDDHDRRPTFSSARLSLNIMLRCSTGQSCWLSHIRSPGPMLDENQLIMLNNDVTKQCEKSVTPPVPMLMSTWSFSIVFVAPVLLWESG